MRRLFLLLCLLFAVPALGAGLLDNRPSATLGAINNSSDFLPVREAFKLNLISSTPESIKLRFVPTEGYYLYRHKFAFKTEPADIALGAAQLPPGEAKHDEYFGNVEVYHGILDVDIPRPANDSRPFTLVVTYQGCADKGLCYPPETERLAIEGTAAPATGHPEKSWNWRELALFFLAGIGLTFTPCVLPMLPILSGVVLRGQVGGLRGFSLSLAYVLPMAACFALLGALMGLFGAQLNLQARLQSVWVLVPFALFFGVFALAMFGVFELKLPQAISNRLDRVANRTQGGSLWGAAVLGVVSSLLVSPCVSAPLAGALLYISASGDALGGGLKLFALGLGMGAPLLLVANLARTTSYMSRPNSLHNNSRYNTISPTSCPAWASLSAGNWRDWSSVSHWKISTSSDISTLAAMARFFGLWNCFQSLVSRMRCRRSVRCSRFIGVCSPEGAKLATERPLAQVKSTIAPPSGFD